MVAVAAVAAGRALALDRSEDGRVYPGRLQFRDAVGRFAYVRGRLHRLRSILAPLSYVMGALVAFAILFAFFGSGKWRFIFLMVFMPLGIWMQARSWRRMREDRYDRQERWGIRR